LGKAIRTRNEAEPRLLIRRRPHCGHASTCSIGDISAPSPKVRPACAPPLVAHRTSAQCTGCEGKSSIARKALPAGRRSIYRALKSPWLGAAPGLEVLQQEGRL